MTRKSTRSHGANEMTFEEWVKSAAGDGLFTNNLQQNANLAWHARDAEIAMLKLEVESSVFFERQTAKERNQLREQVTLLEKEVARLDKGWHEANGIILEEALAATEPKEKGK